MTSHENDIGLAQTYWQMALGRINADKIKLPEPDMLVNPGMELNISGWGIISYEKPNDKIKWSEFLQFATVSTIDQQQCLKDYPESSKAYIFCARGEEGANVCTTVGDRGGPAANNRVLLGIIIATFNINCDSPKPDLFSDVSKYISWIKTYIHDL
ncbi:hypothetical protein RDWZM_001801 [Blomia tropicalis]|uniref:Peptidase S1 domain-containing protein n=1 Tax=Blomia tropicalis TaxID=40697 RepID=A0A9Q0RRM6_BLOTA|nr:hypothetical protein RDWZM_001801 [Blomia tropicalis]